MASRIPGQATVRDVAAATGVSIATVSRVLNGRAHVAEETRRRVQEAVDRLGGHSVASASGGPRTVTHPVYVRCPYPLTDYFGPIVSSIAETLRLHGREMLLDAGEAAPDRTAVRRLPSRRDIAGAVLILPPEPIDDLHVLRAAGFPFVVIDPRVPVPRDTLAVSAAHFAGARQAASHLVALGHRRIGVVSGPPHWMATSARLSGTASALADVGALFDPALQRQGKDGEPVARTGIEAGGELLDLPSPPTAIVCFNDKVAVGVLQAAAARGIRVPEDLSVTGFDDIDVAGAATPQITTVRQPLQEMGRMGVTMLMRVLNGHDAEALHIELATELVERASTGPVPPRR